MKEAAEGFHSFGNLLNKMMTLVKQAEGSAVPAAVLSVGLEFCASKGH